MTKTHWERERRKGKEIGRGQQVKRGLTAVSGVELRKGCELLLSHRGWYLARGHTRVQPLMHFY